MKATATAVMYDLRGIIYERGGMQIDVFMFTLRGCVGPFRDPQMEECGGKDVEAGAPSHVRGDPIYPLRSCESKSPDAGGLGRHGSR